MLFRIDQIGALSRAGENHFEAVVQSFQERKRGGLQRNDWPSVLLESDSARAFFG